MAQKQSTTRKVIDILKKYLISANFHYLSMNFKMSHREKENCKYLPFLYTQTYNKLLNLSPLGNSPPSEGLGEVPLMKYPYILFPKKKQKRWLKTCLFNTLVSFLLSSSCKTEFQKVLSKGPKER